MSPFFIPGRDCSLHVCDDSEEQPICLNGGSCFGNSECLCPPNYVGPHCGISICDDIIRCENGGMCNPETGRCDCVAGFRGRECGVDVCDHKPCFNGGTCFRGNCTCAPGYHGEFCEIDTDDCMAEPCENNGTCHDLVDDFYCSCPPEYVGSFCQTPEVELRPFVVNNGTDADERRGDFPQQGPSVPQQGPYLPAANGTNTNETLPTNVTSSSVGPEGTTPGVPGEPDHSTEGQPGSNGRSGDPVVWEPGNADRRHRNETRDPSAVHIRKEVRNTFLFGVTTLNKSFFFKTGTSIHTVFR